MMTSVSLLLALPKHKINIFKTELNENFQIFDFPVLELIEKDFELSENYLQNFDYLVFGSSFAVQSFFKRAQNLKIPKSLQFLAIGPSVQKALSEQNYSVNFIPNIFNFESLGLELIKKNLIFQKKFLIICGEKTLSYKLEKQISAFNGVSEQLIVYTQKTPSLLLWDNLINFIQSTSSNKLICLSSPEGVNNFFSSLNKKNIQLNSSISFLALGRATQSEIYFKNSNNSQIHITKEYSYKGMQEFIKEYF